MRWGKERKKKNLARKKEKANTLLVTTEKKWRKGEGVEPSSHR